MEHYNADSRAIVMEYLLHYCHKDSAKALLTEMKKLDDCSNSIPSSNNRKCFSLFYYTVILYTCIVCFIARSLLRRLFYFFTCFVMQTLTCFIILLDTFKDTIDWKQVEARKGFFFFFFFGVT